MSLSSDQFAQLQQYIEDGELDDWMLELRTAIDERNARQREAILKLVRSVWGDDAQIVSTTASAPAQTGNVFVDRARARDPIPYVPDDGPQIPAAVPEWPSPVQSAGSLGGVPSGEQPVYSPVADPLAAGSSNAYGDGDPNIVSTGAQIG